MAEGVLAAPDLVPFVARQIKPEKHGITEAELATAITEIEIQTQISGASFLKIHIADADPMWGITASGLIRLDPDGLLNELELEFPKKTGYFWRLAAIEATTEVGQANLILTFEDRVVSNLRLDWEHRTAPPGLTTRAQFVRALVQEANAKHHLKPAIRFVCPGVNRIEPIAEAHSTHTASVTTQAHENRERGIHAGAQELKVGGSPMTPGQRQVANELLGVANLEGANQVAAEALIIAGIGESKLGKPSVGGTLQSNHPPFDTVSQAKNFLKGNEDFQGGGAIKLSHSSADPMHIALEVEKPGIAYETQAGGQHFHAEATAIVAAGGGVHAGGTSVTTSTNEENVSDVGQLSRGTSTQPHESTWDCIQRLAQEVNWHGFTDGRNTLFYMDGPDLINQRPVCYIDVKRNHIIKEDKAGQRVDEYGAIIRPLSFVSDNTAVEYRATHKVHGRIQRKSKIAKPQTPAEIRLLMLCGLTEFRAGDVFVFRNCGPISENGGRWIVSDATRECLRLPYTKFILVPSTEPLPEPKSSLSKTESNVAGTGTAATAFEVSSALSSLQIPYVYGGNHTTNGNTNNHPSGLDCSSSVCWVLFRAGMFGATPQTSGELETFGEAGAGKEMTVWANATHTFIEFNVPGHGRAQMNTNGPQNGPRLYTLSQTATYNPNPAAEGFVARHFKGT